MGQTPEWRRAETRISPFDSAFKAESLDIAWLGCRNKGLKLLVSGDRIAAALGASPCQL
jgi:hypothetical protein